MTSAEIEVALRQREAQLTVYANAKGQIVVSLIRPRARLAPAKIVTRWADRFEDALEFALVEWDATWRT